MKLPFRPILWLSVLSAFSFGCGKDAERAYAGLSVAEVTTKSGVGYRLRYRAPPWELVDDDALVTGKRREVPIGERTAKIEDKSATVLEIERVSLVQNGQGFQYPKYRAEAAVLPCDVAVNAGESCAKQIAAEDARGRSATAQTAFFSPSIRESKNDFGTRYFELMTRDLDTARYARIGYFETTDSTRYVRLAMEANPILDETEVTRMFNAFEIITGPGLNAEGDAGSEDGGP